VIAPEAFEVQSPAGGKLILRSQEEVDLYTEMDESYRKDYRLVRQSELVLLGSILSQALALYRATQDMSGMHVRRDKSGIPTGEYEHRDLKPAERAAIQKIIADATKEIRDTEKALGIDKKSRDAGNQESVAAYIATLKRAAHRMGVHIHERVKKYEEFNMALQWRLRLLRNGDDEDKKYHDLSPEKVCKWAEEQLAGIDDFNKQFAKSQSKLFGGKL
jgi:hypothetical protein